MRAPVRILPSIFALAVALVLSSADAQACSLCHSPEAIELRQRVLGPDFFRNLLSLAAPLPLLTAAIYLAGLEPFVKRKETQDGA